jgi:hypothetical protein
VIAFQCCCCHALSMHSCALDTMPIIHMVQSIHANEACVSNPLRPAKCQSFYDIVPANSSSTTRLTKLLLYQRTPCHSFATMTRRATGADVSASYRITSLRTSLLFRAQRSDSDPLVNVGENIAVRISVKPFRRLGEATAKQP